MGRDLAVTRSSPDSCSFCHRSGASCRAEMADIEQGQQIIPFIACEIPLCQDVCKSILGVDVFDLDLGIKIYSIEQQIKSNPMSSGDVSHCRTWSFTNWAVISNICFKVGSS